MSATFDISRAPVYIPHPAGEWKAEFTKWEKVAHPEYGNRVQLTFQTEVIDDETGEAKQISCWTKPNLHAKGKISLMLVGAFSINPDTDISDDELKSGDFLSRFVGQRLRLGVTNEPSEKDKSKIVDRITAFLPYARKAVKTASKFADEDAPPATAPPAKPAAGIPDLSDDD